MYIYITHHMVSNYLDKYAMGKYIGNAWKCYVKYAGSNTVNIYGQYMYMYGKSMGKSFQQYQKYVRNVTDLADTTSRWRTYRSIYLYRYLFFPHKTCLDYAFEGLLYRLWFIKHPQWSTCMVSTIFHCVFSPA